MAFMEQGKYLKPHLSYCFDNLAIRIRNEVNALFVTSLGPDLLNVIFRFMKNNLWALGIQVRLNGLILILRLESNFTLFIGMDGDRVNKRAPSKLKEALDGKEYSS